MTDQGNPRERIGANNPPSDFRMMEEERLREEYPSLAADVTALLDDARKLPAKIENDQQMADAAKLAAKIMDKADAIQADREREKKPHLDRGSAVDEYFNTQGDKLAQRNKKERPGAADVLKKRIANYNAAKIAAEQAKRDKEAADAKRERDRLQKEADDKARAAAEAQAAANRARKPENVADRQQQADELASKAAEANAAVALAEDRAHGAYIETLAKPNELVGIKIEDGPKIGVTMEKYAEIVDADKLDKNKLWPFISDEAKEKALKQWAKNTGHNHQMDGAVIGERPKTNLRR